jgi:hypothetical protein
MRCSGARRLTREGTDSAFLGGNPLGARQGGSAGTWSRPATSATRAAPPASSLNNAASVPDIRSRVFGRCAAACRSPIAGARNRRGTEAHAIGGGFSDAGNRLQPAPANRCGADLALSRAAQLGLGASGNRHECTDCHNPHRVVKFRSFRRQSAGSLSDRRMTAGTHRHDDATNGYTPSEHRLVASCAARWGVEPLVRFGARSSRPAERIHAVKRGDPGTSVGTNARVLRRG